MTALRDDASDSEIDVSVIVANYNGEKFIADAIRSACSRTLTGIEIIVCDDASTDSSVQIVKSLMADDGRIRLISPAPTVGLRLHATGRSISQEADGSVFWTATILCTRTGFGC